MYRHHFSTLNRNFCQASGVHRGVTLIELMIVMALSSVLLAAFAHVFLTSKISLQVNKGLATIQENGRFALASLERHIRMAGYQERNITGGPLDEALLGNDGGEDSNNNHDRITLFFGAGKNTGFTNCAGQPAEPERILRITYSVSEENTLLCTSQSSGSDEVIELPIGSGVEAMTLNYGEDSDGDGTANRFVRFNGINDPRNIIAVRLCLTVNSLSRAGVSVHEHVDCEGQKVISRDGLLRATFTSTVTLRNRA